ncbi:MAG TPA: efflux RND transporter periplasmic adaptor subunit, partial [Steroidobacteraceae bacterium]|nr:efflux RND transporter periplasmic adaptor subunit [Steroidobacteraceae bacterium]
QARGKRDVARANLEQSDTMLRYATISAPFSGVITQRFVDPGALIQTGTASGAAIVTLMDFSKVRLQVAVPEIEAGKVAVGEPVAVSSDSVAGTSFDGKIARFSYALDNASRTMLAEVSLNNPKLLLRPGMLVTAKIGIEHKESTLILPLEAVVTDKTGSYAYLLSDGKANKRPIKTGFKDAKEVEVLEGLTVADEVILASKLTLSNGQAVKLAAAQ